MMKALNKVGTEENILNMIKVIYEKLTANIILCHWNTVWYTSKIRNMTKLPAFTTLLNILLEFLAKAIKEKEI
jgi:hypothetical protein